MTTRISLSEQYRADAAKARVTLNDKRRHPMDPHGVVSYRNAVGQYWYEPDHGTPCWINPEWIISDGSKS